MPIRDLFRPNKVIQHFTIVNHTVKYADAKHKASTLFSLHVITLSALIILLPS